MCRYSKFIWAYCKEYYSCTDISSSHIFHLSRDRWEWQNDRIICCTYSFWNKNRHHTSQINCIWVRGHGFILMVMWTGVIISIERPKWHSRIDISFTQNNWVECCYQFWNYGPFLKVKTTKELHRGSLLLDDLRSVTIVWRNWWHNWSMISVGRSSSDTEKLRLNLVHDFLLGG